jgi:hypothetical protein
LTYYSRGHSFVQNSGYVFTYMNGKLYFFDAYYAISNSIINFELLQTPSGPPNGLINYGMQLTEKEKLIIYGGQIETTSTPCAIRKRIFNLYNQLWMLDMRKNIFPDFVLIKWISSPGGFSKIISLGGEIICILNAAFINQMKIIDFDIMSSYEIHVSGIPAGVTRTGFGIVQANSTEFILYGGYDESGPNPKYISPFNILYQISFSKTYKIDTLRVQSHAFDSTLITGIVVGIVSGIIIIVFVGFTYKKWKKEYNVHKIERAERLMKELEEANIALENSKKVFEDRMKNITEDPEFTATLVLPNSNQLAVPGYLLMEFNKDYRPGKVLAQGGMGQVLVGTILNNDIAKEYNNGETECIIKRPLKEIDDNVFLQELALHEVFRKVKYFARLICFSKEPKAIVLKFYKLGSLKEFIYEKESKPKFDQYDYELDLAIFLGKKIAWSLNFMHMKGYIHNDIKPDNILLDSDQEESLFPVITDFGIVHITDEAKVVKGINKQNLLAATMTYAPPERLQAILKKTPLKNTPKSDVYSFAILYLELLTRRHPWEKKFDHQKVIQGLRPNINFNFDGAESGPMKATENLIILCWDGNPEVRPTMREVYDRICECGNITS